MVRKVICISAVVLLLFCVATATASAEDVYEGTISSTYYSIVEEIPISPLSDYVFFRSGQSSYVLLVGDIEYSSNKFTLVSDGKVFTINQVSGSGYSSSHYQYSVSDVSSYTVNTNGILVYSNLGGYPDLHKEQTFDFITMFLLLIIGLCAFIRPVFAFSMRMRGR